MFLSTRATCGSVSLSVAAHGVRRDRVKRVTRRTHSIRHSRLGVGVGLKDTFEGKENKAFLRGTRIGAKNDQTTDVPVPYRPPLPMRATDGTISEVPTGWIGTSSDSAGASSAPQTTNLRYTTLAERLANNDGLRRNFTIGLKWWTPLSPLNGFIGVAEACSRLWENTVLLSALITSFSMYAVTFPIREIIDAQGHVPQTYAACWTLAFCFCATSGFGATILLNKICKCAPQNYALWFSKFGGFVELPQLFLYLGGWCAFAGCLVVLTPIYKSNALTVVMVVVFLLCGSLVTAMYSQTTDFEKACAKQGERLSEPRGEEREISEAFEREVAKKARW